MDDKCVFTMCVRLGRVDTCLASGREHVCVFFSPPHKQRTFTLYKMELKCNMQSLGEVVEKGLRK